MRLAVGGGMRWSTRGELARVGRIWVLGNWGMDR